MKTKIILFLSPIILFGCMKAKSVDLIVHNAKIHVMDENNSIVDAIAVKDGKIVEIGPERQIMNKYRADEFVDAGQKEIYPGLTDAHGHILSYARQLLSVDLVGCKSFNDLVKRVDRYIKKTHAKTVIGRGWDQSLWGTNDLPVNDILNEKFPSIPILLHRVDGHAALANQKTLDLAGITPMTKVDGGEFTVKNGKCTGILLDNAIPMVANKLPDYSKKELSEAILRVQKELLQYGITGVHEAGVENKDLKLIQELSNKDELFLDLYIMLRPSKENIAFAKKNKIYNKKNLVVRSFKVMGDGALGSRGALLKKPYQDAPHTHGLLTTTPKEMKRIAAIALSIGYQVNIHAIGDSTNSIVLSVMKEAFARNKDHRWRIEHAQVVDPADFKRFAETGAFPSVQPTHAVSDQRWVDKRLGKNRLKGAYAYKTLLNQTGMLALGTDFPVELTNPYLTLRAAVQRQDANGVPMKGFLPKEALTELECLKGMTIWPAYASFQEQRLGSLEEGKEATFTILSEPLKLTKKFKSNYAELVYINGKKKYSAR